MGSIPIGAATKNNSVPITGNGVFYFYFRFWRFLFAFHSSNRTTVLNAPNGLYALKKTLQRFRFLFYLSLPRIPARMVLLYRLYIYLCPAILNALTVISGSRFFWTSIIFRKNHLLPVLIWNPCRLFSFHCQTVPPKAQSPLSTLNSQTFGILQKHPR